MELNIRDLTQEQQNWLKRKMLTVCRDYEPWADFMLLGGDGEPGVDRFPLDLEEIESINITLVGREESQESVTASPEVQVS